MVVSLLTKKVHLDPVAAHCASLGRSAAACGVAEMRARNRLPDRRQVPPCGAPTLVVMPGEESTLLMPGGGRLPPTVDLEK